MFAGGLWFLDGRQTLAHGALRRVVPSAGGIYPLKLAVRVYGKPPVYLSDPLSEKLIDAGFVLPEESMSQVFGHAELEKASFVIMIFADLEMVGRKYGERAYRFCCIEAGHVAQNVVMWAERTSLGSLCLGGSDDQLLTEMGGGLQHLYAVAVGRAAASDGRNQS